MSKVQKKVLFYFSSNVLPFRRLYENYHITYVIDINFGAEAEPASHAAAPGSIPGNVDRSQPIIMKDFNSY